MKTGNTLRRLALALAALVFAASMGTYLSAADAVIKGVVTDEAGKPIRYAHVKATIGTKSISRFTGPDGRYEITVPAGSYDVSAEAYGFGLRRAAKDAAQAGEVNFKLAPRVDVMRLSSSEVEYLVPDDEEGRMIETGCFECHGHQTVLAKRGWTAAEWEEFLPRMTVLRWGNNMFGNQERNARVAKALEKHFGPNGVLGPDAETPDLSKVTHTEPSPEVLRATITEYTIPTAGTMPHSVTVDEATGTVWFSSYDARTNTITRFDPKTEKFEEFVIPVAKSLPHTGSVMKDGSFIVALAQNGLAAKLARVDRAGKMTVYEYPEEMKDGGHTSALNPAGDTVWITTNSEDEIWAFDVKTAKFRTYKIPVPTTFPEGSQAALTARPGDKPRGSNYDVAADSKGFAWVSQLPLGNLVRVDPKTGETAVFHTPEMRSVRGVAVDAQDNVWWADFYGHKLGKLDQKTGAIKLYQTPTPLSTPYGIAPDSKNGYIWLADTLGNNMTRFDPKTETFVEYPLPTRNASVRFAGIDAQGRVWYGGFWNGKLGVIDTGTRSASQTAAR